MFKTQQISGPVSPGQYGPLQVSGPGSYYPQQTTDWTSMFSSMMPMIMMIMMMAIIMPMMRGVTASAKE